MTNRITNPAHENARAKGFHKHGDEIRRRLQAARGDVENWEMTHDRPEKDEALAYARAEVEFYENVLAEHYGNRLFLIVGEVVEAHEELRSGHDVDEVYLGPDGKPEGVPIELADVKIRLDDTVGEMQIDISAAEGIKSEFNAQRAAMHGGRKF